MAWGQFEMQNSGTTASLRGIDAVGAGVAWASGTDGTVIRTEDGGYLWQRCAVPAGAEKLDFRGVQGFDANTAVVMASGKGEASGVWKTTDGCQTWLKVFANPDGEGFFDAIRVAADGKIYVLGDPVGGKFALFVSEDKGATWLVAGEAGRDTEGIAGAFAASNSALVSVGPYLMFGTGVVGAAGPRIYRTGVKCEKVVTNCLVAWTYANVPMQVAGEAAGVFSIAGRMGKDKQGQSLVTGVAVGGDYSKPAMAGAVYTIDGGAHWLPAEKMPGGYRSAVAWDATSKSWLAVGPGGADVSRDDGKNWTALTGENVGGWNAISLPFVVGPKGRVGRVMLGGTKGVTPR